MQMLAYVCNMYRGGTMVTVYGRNLDSVAEPRITLTTVITETVNITSSIVTTMDPNSEVTVIIYYDSTPLAVSCGSTKTVSYQQVLTTTKHMENSKNNQRWYHLSSTSPMTSCC